MMWWYLVQDMGKIPSQFVYVPILAYLAYYINVLDFRLSNPEEMTHREAIF